MNLTKHEGNIFIPTEVMELHLGGLTLLDAWRQYANEHALGDKPELYRLGKDDKEGDGIGQPIKLHPAYYIEDPFNMTKDEIMCLFVQGSAPSAFTNGLGPLIDPECRDYVLGENQKLSSWLDDEPVPEEVVRHMWKLSDEKLPLMKKGESIEHYLLPDHKKNQGSEV